MVQCSQAKTETEGGAHMDIVKLKAEIAQYDQQEKRMPVYACLKEA